jgi:hypothetical protein
MENQIINNDYYQNKNKAKKLYSNIGEIWCPVLNDHITFNNIGFKHLTRKGKRPRSNKDQFRRFNLLKFTKNIIEDPDSKITVKSEENILNKKVRTFWAIRAEKNQKTIIIVIRQIGMGKKHFFSIYDQKTAL